MKTTAHKDVLIKKYLSFLTESGISLNTLKFYSSDLTHFSHWCKKEIEKTAGSMVKTFSEALPFLSSELSAKYKNFLVEAGASRQTVNRKLSSLRGIASYLVTTEVLNSDFMEAVGNLPASNQGQGSDGGDFDFLNEFKSYLESEKSSESTVKNYIADVRQFMSFINNNAQAN